MVLADIISTLLIENKATKATKRVPRITIAWKNVKY